tara:strand:- start:14611 stop:15021 length:411 start_codon:yes stop_codon:yes gene_type:complete
MSISITGKKIDFVMKLYFDDIEDALRLKNGFSISIDENQKLNSNYEYVEEYISENFKIYFNSEKVDLIFLDKKIINDVLELKTSIQFEDKIINIKIKNKILLDVYDNQSNIVFIKNLEKKKYYKFDISNTEKNINY